MGKPLPQFDENDSNCVETLMDKYRQSPVYKRWMYCESNSNGADKQRLIVITNLRVFAIKRGKMKRRQVRHAYPIVELKEVAVTDRFHPVEMKRVKLAFHSHEDPLTIIAHEHHAEAIVKAVLKNSRIITYGHPDHRLPIVNVDDKYQEGTQRPDMTPNEAIIKGYEVGCDFLEILPKFEIIKSLKDVLDTDAQRIPFALRRIFPQSPIDPSHVQAVCLSVQYSDKFADIDAAHCPLGDDGLASLAIALSGNVHIQGVDVMHCKAGWSGIYRLARNLKTCSHIPLTKLIVSRNKMGDGGMEELELHLKDRPVEVLGISQCNMSGKGFKALASLCMSQVWLDHLQLLDISGNNAGKTGTRHLAKYLEIAKNLRVLTATRCHLDCAVIMEHLARNEPLWKHVMSSLNLSGNKLGASFEACEMFADILKQTETLGTIAMAHVKFDALTFRMLMTGVLSNRTPLEFALDFRGNDLKGQMGEVFSDLGKTAGQNDDGLSGAQPGVVHNIKTLILSGNHFGVEGMERCCEGLSHMKSLQNLVLDRNVQTGTDGRERAGEAVGDLVRALPNLRMLSFQGAPAEVAINSYSMGPHLKALFRALEVNTSLTRLDLSANKLTDEDAEAISRALCENPESELSVLNLSDNRFDAPGVDALVKAVQACPLLATVKVIGDRTATPSFDMRDSLGDLEKAQVENRNALKNAPQKLHLRSPTILLGFRSNMFGQGPRPTQDLSQDPSAATSPGSAASSSPERAASPSKSFVSEVGKDTDDESEQKGATPDGDEDPPEPPRKPSVLKAAALESKDQAADELEPPRRPMATSMSGSVGPPIPADEA